MIFFFKGKLTPRDEGCHVSCEHAPTLHNSTLLLKLANTSGTFYTATSKTSLLMTLHIMLLLNEQSEVNRGIGDAPMATKKNSLNLSGHSEKGRVTPREKLVVYLLDRTGHNHTVTHSFTKWDGFFFFFFFFAYASL